jgi:hypothetical protein
MAGMLARCQRTKKRSFGVIASLKKATGVS